VGGELDAVPDRVVFVAAGRTKRLTAPANQRPVISESLAGDRLIDAEECLV
jgi:hypothetical protein